MAGKIQLKLKPKAPVAAAPAAAPVAGAAAAFAMPAAGKSGGITIELRGASVHIAEVVVVKR
jgi:CO dehydrogenase/acetyl-CoA synthase beta subunit